LFTLFTCHFIGLFNLFAILSVPENFSFQDLEVQMMQDSDELNDQVAVLQESLRGETHRREDAEQECTRQKQVVIPICLLTKQLILLTVDFQELRYAHDELVKQKSSFQSRMQDREGEINRLRAQVELVWQPRFFLIQNNSFV
jgi:hypothetical protein